MLSVFEAGIGAVNLPLMSGMLGSKSTRSSHPTFLRLMSGLLTAVAGRDIRIEQPFLAMTKGELVTLMASHGPVELVHATQSCLHPLRMKLTKQCGLCPACIFRRQALAVAGIHEEIDGYLYDIFDPATTSRRQFWRKAEYLRAFLLQVDKLSPLDESDDLPDFLRRHLASTGLLSDGEDGSEYAVLYRRYRKEWLAIAEEGLRGGLTWARLLVHADAGT
jgi:hypothetical protein